MALEVNGDNLTGPAPNTSSYLGDVPDKEERPFYTRGDLRLSRSSKGESMNAVMIADELCS